MGHGYSPHPSPTYPGACNAIPPHMSAAPTPNLNTSTFMPGMPAPASSLPGQLSGTAPGALPNLGPVPNVPPAPLGAMGPVPTGMPPIPHMMPGAPPAPPAPAQPPPPSPAPMPPHSFPGPPPAPPAPPPPASPRSAPAPPAKDCADGAKANGNAEWWAPLNRVSRTSKHSALNLRLCRSGQSFEDTIGEETRP